MPDRVCQQHNSDQVYRYMTLQTYTRLQKLNLTVSHPSLIRLLNKVGSTFDEKATIWRDGLLNLLRTSETSVRLLLQYGGQ